MVEDNFDRAAHHLDINPAWRHILLRPERETVVGGVVRMHDATPRRFTGYRVAHRTACGPTNRSAGLRTRALSPRAGSPSAAR